MLSIDIVILAQALIYWRQTKLNSIKLNGFHNHKSSSACTPNPADRHQDGSCQDPCSRLMFVKDSSHVV
ncbi:hypothetical protein PtB15_12B161 [Puccinia triticina]|nr:hypothetical protein PtB15_12B161 [Puccinia triticina]